jgi:hypothetical protein
MFKHVVVFPRSVQSTRGGSRAVKNPIPRRFVITSIYKPADDRFTLGKITRFRRERRDESLAFRDLRESQIADSLAAPVN